MILRIVFLLVLFANVLSAQESLDRLRNLAKAHYEEDRFEEAVQLLERCVQLRPESAPDRVNLAIAYIAQKRYDEAIEQLEKARQLDPNLPHIDYNLGIIAKRRGRFKEAAQHLRAVTQLDPADPDARYNLGLMYLRLNQREKAMKEFEKCVELDPEHASAYYHLMRDALRRGDRERADELLKIYEYLRDHSRDQQKTVTALEASVYTALIDVREPVEPQVTPSPIRFVRHVGAIPEDATHDAQNPVWFDWNGDDIPDLWTGTHALVRTGETFQDVTSAIGVPVEPASIVGDVNNDGFVDLWTIGGKLLQNQGDGRFTDVTEPTGIPLTEASARLLLDYDHEGDLDLIVADPQGVRLYQNNGDGTFTEVTQKAGIQSVAEPGSHLYFSDPDGDNDVDFYLARPGQPVELFQNRRAGQFYRVVLPFRSSGHLAIGDYDNDGDFDLISVDGDLILYRNRGKARFEEAKRLKLKADGVRALVPLDFDNDGYLDLLVLWDRGITLYRGPHLNDITESSGLEGTYRSAAPADFDLDGDWDLLLVDEAGTLVLFENQGGTNHWIRLSLKGIKNNVQGWMSRVDVKADRFFLRREVTANPVLIGVGPRKQVDVVRVLWPNGVAQNQIDVTTDQAIHFEEKQGMPSSCPLLFTWNGERFVYVTDLVDAGALGVPLGPGEYLKPDADEYVKIRGDQLQPKDGFYEMRITAELHEVIYLDSVELWVIDHPEGTELYPNEAFGERLPSPAPIQIVHDARPPLKAWTQDGQDVLPLIREFDGFYPVPFELLPRYQGLATDHTLFLQLPPTDEPSVLWFTGWIDWTDGSSNLAVAQHSSLRVLEPRVEVWRDGQWRLVTATMGTPAGYNKSVPVLLPPHDGQVRLTTNLRLYWDKIIVSQQIEERNQPDARLHPLDADLHFRGFSEIVRESLTSPNLFRYDRVHRESPFVPFQGAFTRYGDVTELLQAPDDRYVIMAPGDEISVRFLAVAPPRPGTVRDYFLYTHGWLKDGDLNTAFGTTVEPLPFHAMSNYPYPAGESYPDDEAHLTYRRTYNTRRETSLP